MGGIYIMYKRGQEKSIFTKFTAEISSPVVVSEVVLCCFPVIITRRL